METSTTLSYSTKLILQPEDKQKIIEFLELEREIFNFCSRLHFGSTRNSIVDLHAKCYKEARKLFNAKSQIVIKAENNCLSAYRSAKSNKHDLKTHITKKRLSTGIDQRLYSFDGENFRLTTSDRRVITKPVMYSKLEYAIQNYRMCDPRLSSKDGEVYITLIFEVKTNITKPKSCIGVDLGVRRIATTSEGNIFVDKKFNARKRKLRHLKSKLKSKNTKSSHRHLKKKRNKERNINRNFCHNLANKILDTKAQVIVLEDLNLKKMKTKKHKNDNKNHISQVPFYLIRQMLTYKAGLVNKQVVCVNPAYTSQDDCVTGKRDGVRMGCRYFSKNGLVYDADVNAAINIAKKAKTKLPISQGNLLDGQANVKWPIVSYNKPPVSTGGI